MCWELIMFLSARDYGACNSAFKSSIRYRMAMLHGAKVSSEIGCLEVNTIHCALMFSRRRQLIQCFATTQEEIINSMNKLDGFCLQKGLTCICSKHWVNINRRKVWNTRRSLNILYHTLGVLKFHDATWITMASPLFPHVITTFC